MKEHARKANLQTFTERYRRGAFHKQSVISAGEVFVVCIRSHYVSRWIRAHLTQFRHGLYFERQYPDRFTSTHSPSASART
jgi:hypothetical protein